MNSSFHGLIRYPYSPIQKIPNYSAPMDLEVICAREALSSLWHKRSRAYRFRLATRPGETFNLPRLALGRHIRKLDFASSFALECRESSGGYSYQVGTVT